MKFAVVQQPEPPWTFVDCLKANPAKNNNLKLLPQCRGRYGSAVDVTLILATFLNLEIDLVWSSTWGAQSNGTWVGAVGDVMRHEVHSCVPQVSPSVSRSMVVDFTGYVFMDQNICFGYCRSTDSR